MIFFCFLSSVSVFGNTGDTIVDESSCCNPENDYGKSKLASEIIILQSQKIPRIVILRPTNVVAPENPTTLKVVLNRNLMNIIKVIIQGQECCHAVHVDNVVSAVGFFILKKIASPQIYIVSSDDDENNTFSGIAKIWKSVKYDLPASNFSLNFSLPLCVPDFLRLLYPPKTVSGRVRYTSRKLIGSGFIFPMNVVSTVEDVLKKSIPGKNTICRQ